jgi:hypothetical protein
MHEFIYKYNGIYYREVTDLLGNSLLKEVITEDEYYSYKDSYRAKVH